MTYKHRDTQTQRAHKHTDIRRHTQGHKPIGTAPSGQNGEQLDTFKAKTHGHRNRPTKKYAETCTETNTNTDREARRERSTRRPTHTYTPTYPAPPAQGLANSPLRPTEISSTGRLPFSLRRRPVNRSSNTDLPPVAPKATATHNWLPMFAACGSAIDSGIWGFWNLLILWFADFGIWGFGDFPGCSC